MIEMHAIAKGRVQGVGFRATVKHYASEMGLSGTVRNLADGTVEIYAQGDEALLRGLLQKLESDGGLGCVESFTTDYYEAKRTIVKFQIIF